MSSQRPRRPAPRKGAGGEPAPPATSIASALDAYLRSQGHEEVGALGAVDACWAEVVGGEVAAHARPRALRGDVLVVAVDHAGWATQLAFLSEQVLASLEHRLGRRVAATLEVTTRRRPDVE